MSDSAVSLPVPRCEIGDEDTFVFVHNCLTYLNGEALQHPTPLVGDRRSLPLEGLGRPGWAWVGEPGKTIHPSIDCRRCGTHGFWIEGEWRPVR
jgi:hypothetical protein